MLDIIKKSIYLGLGAATATKEKVDSLVEELMDKIEKEEQEVAKRIKAEILKAIEEIGLPTKKDIDELNKRLKALEKKLSEKGN